MGQSQIWPGGSSNVTPATYEIPGSGEVNWSDLSDFLLALAQGSQSTTFQKWAVRQATTSPVTLSPNDCVVLVKLDAPAASTLTLPVGSNKQVLVIGDASLDALTNNITITCSGSDTVAGSSELILSTNGESVVLVFASESSDWKIAVRSRPNPSGISLQGLTPERALQSSAEGSLIASAVSSVELGYLAGLTSGVQNQLDTLTSNVSTNTADIATNATGIAAATSVGTTNTADIATNTSNIATNTASIATNTANIQANTSGVSSNASSILTNQNEIALKQDDVLTTKGDLVIHDGSGATRLAAGTDGLYLKADSSEAGGAVWSSVDATVPDASPVQTGSINTVSQAFAGVKTFNSGIAAGAGSTLSEMDFGTWSITGFTNIGGTNTASASASNLFWQRFNSRVYAYGRIEGLATNSSANCAFLITHTGLIGYTNTTIPQGQVSAVLDQGSFNTTGGTTINNSLGSTDIVFLVKNNYGTGQTFEQMIFTIFYTIA